jgi:hypothetical protein
LSKGRQVLLLFLFYIPLSSKGEGLGVRFENEIWLRERLKIENYALKRINPLVYK